MEINSNNSVVDINLLQPNEYNPKLDFRGDDNLQKEFDKIKRSLKELGQVQPVLVRDAKDGKFEIINGYHRWSAMKELECKEIEIKNLGNIDLDKAISYALFTEDTKIPIDAIELAGLMKKIVTPEKPLDYWAKLLPYDAELIKNKIDLLEFDFSEFDKDEGPDSRAYRGGAGFDRSVFQDESSCFRPAWSVQP